MDIVTVIRYKIQNEGKSIRRVAEELDVSRNTVRKYLKISEPARSEKEPRPCPVKDLDRQLTARFQALVSHYSFEPCFARVGEGHDKGGVESRGKVIRLQHLTPIPQGESLEEISQFLLGKIEERTLGRLHNRYLNVALLVVDEVGFTPFNKLEGELLFNLLADRYERKSTIVTTNLNFNEWVQVFGSEKLTTALLDRLVHHAEILTTKGSSYRTRNKKQKKE